MKHGSVHGGAQTIIGVTIQLYAVGTTGDGSAATPLLTQSVVTDENGAFTITGDYMCPSAGALSGTGITPGASFTMVANPPTQYTIVGASNLPSTNYHYRYE